MPWQGCTGFENCTQGPSQTTVLRERPKNVGFHACPPEPYTLSPDEGKIRRLHRAVALRVLGCARQRYAVQGLGFRV